MSAPRIEATGLTKRFARGRSVVPAVEGVDLVVGAGELVVVTGTSLSGKTTLIELLAGWRRPDLGSVRWSGQAQPPPWPALTVIPQALALVDEVTVVENIGLAHRVAPGQSLDGDRLDALLHELGLERLRDRRVTEISIGERQRAMVARALIDQPQVVLADEPVAHQDERHAEIVLDLLRAAVDGGAAAVVTTRRPEVAAAGDRVLSLTGGG